MFTYKPITLLKVTEDGKHIDWEKTGLEVARVIKKEMPDDGWATQSMTHADIMIALQKLVKRNGVRVTIAALQSDPQEKKDD